MNGRRLFKMIEDFANNVAGGFGLPPINLVDEEEPISDTADTIPTFGNPVINTPVNETIILTSSTASTTTTVASTTLQTTTTVVNADRRPIMPRLDDQLYDPWSSIDEDNQTMLMLQHWQRLYQNQGFPFSDKLPTTISTTTTSTTTTTTTTTQMNWLEKVKKEGALSTWNMPLKEKFRILKELSKQYLDGLDKNKVNKRSSNDLSDITNVLNTISPDLTSQLTQLLGNTISDLSKSNINQENDSVSDQSNIIPIFGHIETIVPNDKYYRPSSRRYSLNKRSEGVDVKESSPHHLSKRSGGFSIFSLLNFMLVVLNIVIDINNNINNNNNNNNVSLSFIIFLLFDYLLTYFQ